MHSLVSSAVRNLWNGFHRFLEEDTEVRTGETPIWGKFVWCSVPTGSLSGYSLWKHLSLLHLHEDANLRLQQTPELPPARAHWAPRPPLAREPPARGSLCRNDRFRPASFAGSTEGRALQQVKMELVEVLRRGLQQVTGHGGLRGLLRIFFR